MGMTETEQEEPEATEPLILESLTDLEEEEEFLLHFPDIRGRAVVNPNGDEVGVVEDLYVNPRNRQVEMAAIKFTGAAGYGGKRTLVPIREIEFVNDEVRIMTREDSIRQAPDFCAGAALYEPYYEYWEGLAETSGAEQEEAAYPAGRLRLVGEEETDEDPRPAAR